MLSRLMQNPLGAAFARKVLRCKARDEGRTLVLFDEARNAAAGHFSCKPFGPHGVLHQPASKAYLFLSGTPPPLKSGLDVSPGCPGGGDGACASLGTSGAGSGGVGTTDFFESSDLTAGGWVAADG